MGGSRWKKSVVGLVTAASTLVLTVALGVSPAESVTIHVQGTATGTAVDVTSPVLPPAGDEGVQVLVSNAHSQIDSDGIGIGSLKAEGKATPASVFVDGVTTAAVAESSTSAPPESTETDSIPDADLGVVQAAVLSSMSHADNDPLISENHSEVASATVVPDAPLVTTSDVTADAITQKLGTTEAPKGKSDAASGVATAGVNIADLLVIDAEVITAEAHALATGSLGGANGSSASASCTILNLTINGNLFPAPPCDGSTLLEIPGVLTVTTGSPTTTVQKNKATASIDALTITVVTGQKIVLAHADAAARRIATVPGNPCLPVSPLATAEALAQVGEVKLLDGTADVDLVKAGAEISTKGVDKTKFVAVADGEAAHATSTVGPIDVAVADSHAKAPPPTSDADAVAQTPPGSPVSGKVLASTATATGPLLYPSASATSDVVEVGDNVTPLGLGVDVGSAEANAARQPGAPPNTPNLVTADSSASAADAGLTVGGVPITVDVIEASAVATATGLPGGADASADFHVASITVGLLVIQPVPDTPGTVIEVPGVVRITVGNIETSESADGQSASASVDALTIESLLTGDVVVLGHAEAAVTSPPQGAILGIRQGADFGDDDLPGTVVHPGDPIRFAFCLTNRGGVTLTGVTLTDQFHPLLEIIDVPAGATVNGQVVTTAPITLQPGEAENLSILVEVSESTPPGTRISNVGTATANELPGPVKSNVISFTVTSG